VNSSATPTLGGVLVLATDAEPSSTLVETVRAAAAGGAPVLVVSPAVTTRLRYWTSDRSRPEAAARTRLLELLDELGRAGVTAEGMVGDADPAQAAADALAVFAPNEVIVASGVDTWQTRGLVRRLQERYEGPILELAASPSPLAPRRRPRHAGLAALEPYH
jgi:hypothetical protein